MKPTSLRCESLLNPLGLDIARPRLSWKLPPSARRGMSQSAWQIQAAASLEKLAAGNADLWDSGRVESSESVLVAYEGVLLPSRARACWKVRVWDETGTASEWSEPAYWEAGLLDSADWQAEWIGGPLAGSSVSTVPAPYLRKEFHLASAIASARLYVTARGLYEFSINGQRVGADVFTPGDTDYAQRIQYQVYDVTALLQPGANAAGAILGDGWYCGYVGWQQRQNYGERPLLLAQIEITYADGTREVVATGADWKTSFGPILEADFLQGEIYDARREMPGWNRPGFDDAAWGTAAIAADNGARRVGMRGPTVRRIVELPGKPTVKPLIYDFGQNMVGFVRIKVSAPVGTTVKIRHAEMLNKDGSLYTTNLRGARATDYYICKGSGEEVWEPRFTFHGFRYVEVEGLPAGTPVEVTGVVVCSDIAPTGQFECSDPLVNQLQKNIQWGQRGNFVDIPTDCPQRNERLGWTGDAQVFIRTAAFNFDVASFFTKWQNDVADAQRPGGEIPAVIPNPLLATIGEMSVDGGPAWADAGVICPWTVYLCYGDKGILAEHYDSMRRFVESMKAASIGLIRSHPDSGKWGGFGDWLALDGGGKTDGITPKDLIGTAFFAYSTRLLARIAAILGREADVAEYEALFEKIRAAYQARFLTPEGLVASGTQTAMVLTLHFDLAPEAVRPAIVKALVRHIEGNGNRLATGFVGTSYLPHVLTRFGRLDVAYRLLHQKQWPSWLYAVTQGATTIWERWDGWTEEKGFQDAGMNSFNHYAYGAIGEWLYATVAGLDLDPEEPAYRHAIVKPRPGGGLTRAAASLETPYGRLASGWEIKDGTFSLDVMVPPNTRATVCVPAVEGAVVLEGGKPAAEVLEAAGWREGGAVFRVGSGEYRFSVAAQEN